MQLGYKCYMEVNLKNLRKNLIELKKFHNIIPVLKSNGYGLGLKEVAKAISNDTDYFAIGNIEEAFVLKEMNIKKGILVLNPILPREYKEAIQNGFIFPVESKSALREILRIGKNKKTNIHVEIDTGMGRSGVPYYEAVNFIRDILNLKEINFFGVYTHLASPEKDPGFTKEQIAKFLNVLSNFDVSKIPLIHAASSAGFISYNELLRKPFNFSRIGILLFGIIPQTQNKVLNLKINEVVKVKATILRVQEIKKGTSIGYGTLFKAQRKMKIATIGAGYGWGLLRKLTNKGYVIIKGKKAKILGSVCMDLIVADVTNIEEVKPGDEVIIVGKQGNEKIDFNEIATIAETIPYEILTNFGNALNKKYIFEEEAK